METPYYNVPNLQKIADRDTEIIRLKAELADKTTMLENQFKANDILDAEITRLKAELFRTKNV